MVQEVTGSIPWHVKPKTSLTLGLPNKLSSTKILVCFNFQSASMSPKVCEYIVWMSNSLDLGETPSYSASHPDPGCLHIELQELLCLVWVRVKLVAISSLRFITSQEDLKSEVLNLQSTLLTNSVLRLYITGRLLKPYHLYPHLHLVI